jgi:PAS domain S-box-containing protein
VHAPIPANEEARLAALWKLDILDTPPDERFERITRVAQRVFGVPIALIGLMDADRQWFKSCRGLDSTETPRDLTFCAYALDGDGPLLVPDATRDPRFAANPSVTGPPHIRSYAGHPLRSPDGHTYGTFCVIDTAPRTFAPDELATLADLAAWCESELNNDELNRAHAARRESEERLRRVITNAPIVLFAADRDGTITLSEGRGLAALGTEPGASLGASIFDRYRDTPAVLDAFRRALDGEEFSQTTVVREVTFETHFAPLHDGAGQVAGAIGVATDVSGRARAEAELRRALAALEGQFRAAERARGETRAVIDAASEGIALVAPDRRFLLANRRFADLFGLTGEAIVGHRFEEFAPLVERVFADPATFQRLVAGTADDTAREFTALVAQRWPQERELQLFSTPVRDEQGGFLGRLYVLRDITREREVERMKSDLISRVSHELRTPLTSIKGFVDLLLDGDAGEVGGEQREFLEIVRNNADRLVALINDLLDMSRIESGRVALKRAAVDLAALVGGVATAHRMAIEGKGQALAIDMPPDLPAVDADADRLRQILDNLLSNAHKYTPRGGAIGITASREGAMVRIAVRDSGIGLALDEQERVFDTFFRARNRATRESIGTGLGLALVRSLVALHGGEICLDSAPGKGSTFSFALPAATPGAPEEGNR